MDGLTSPNLQRARGRIGLSFCGDKLEELYQSGCAKLMLPKTYGEMTEAVMLNTAGGITGGDRLTVKIQAENCARCDHHPNSRTAVSQQHGTGKN